MIQANQIWLNALSQAAKQPLYALEVPGIGVIFTTFDAALLAPTGGYGVIPYGVGGYGQ